MMHDVLEGGEHWLPLFSVFFIPVQMGKVLIEE
jgi:hypothetical protein